MAETDKLALYRLWRPQTFTDVVAQEQIVYPLRQSVISGHFSHAILFSGTRGTGKTSLAKIFAKAINCLQPDRGDPCNECEICRAANDGSLMDISEIDAASHNSVEHMRRLTDEIIFTPLRARYKVYIIDEVHMLSAGAFNALLKTLEEPPSHAVFVMATTEPHRIPATIISRCQHFKFRRIPADEIIARIRRIAESVSLDIDDSALEMIAMLSGGALRDAISLLDQTRQLSATPVGRDDVLTLAGMVPDRFLSETAEAILFNQPETLLINIQELVMSGRDLTRFVTDLGGYFRNLLVAHVSGTPEKLIQLRGEDIQRLTSIAVKTSVPALTDLISGLARLLVDMRLSPDLRTTLEIGLIDLQCRFGSGPTAVPVSHAAAAPSGAISREAENRGAKDGDAELTRSAPAAPPAARTDEAAEDDIRKAAGGAASGAEQVEAGRTHGTAERRHEGLQDLPDEKPPAATIATPSGEKPVLDVWREILDDLQKEHRMDIALCARPARVCMNGLTFEIHFDSNLKGQHSCLSESGNSQLIRQMLSNRAGQRVDLSIVLDQDRGGTDGESAEWTWLRKVREKALIEEIPSPVEGSE